MNKLALASLVSLSTLFAAPMAFAQTFSAGGWISGGVSVSAGVQVGTVPPPPPPPPSVIVVQQQPVYVPPPPPRVVYTTVPTYTYTTTTTVSYLGSNRGRAVGLGGFASGLGFGGRNDSARGMGGVGGTLRFRQHPNFATEFSVAGMVGTDYNNDSRAEVPVTLSELFYLNPQNRFQLYALVGVGASWASGSYNDSNAAQRGMSNAAYTYLGGLAGLGAEWQLTPNFSLYCDARAFIRTRVDTEANSNPEFTRTNSSGARESTNVSTGVVGQLGGIFYF